MVVRSFLTVVTGDVQLKHVKTTGSVGLMANTWWCIAAVLPFAAYLNLCIIPAEEAYLRARFGSSPSVFAYVFQKGRSVRSSLSNKTGD